MPEIGVSILSVGVGKPFLVRPAADDDLIVEWIIDFLSNMNEL